MNSHLQISNLSITRGKPVVGQSLLRCHELLSSYSNQTYALDSRFRGNDGVAGQSPVIHNL